MKNKEKLWGGRFKKPTNKKVECFTESLSFDIRLYSYDIAGSVAHAKMLVKAGILTKKESSKIVKTLKLIKSDMDSCNFKASVSDEDIHMVIEKELIKRIGALGKKLHTARSRNDQVSLDTRMYIKDISKTILSCLLNLQGRMARLGAKYSEVIIPGLTHLQFAMPVTFAHYMLSFVEMFERDKDRVKDALKRVDVLPLGSCALAGTALAIDRKFVAEELGFSAVSANSMDAVSDRDFVIEFLSALSVVGIHLSRLAEDIIYYSSSAVRMMELPEDFCTGSSMMPQKKNPDVAELVRGKSAGLIGNVVAMLTVMKGLPMTYNRDMQEDKKLLFDSVDTVTQMLEITAEFVNGITLNKKVINNLVNKDLGLFATDIAEYLVKKGLPFRDAHHVVGEIMASTIATKKPEEVNLKALKVFSSKFSSDVIKILNAENSVKLKKSSGSPAPSKVKEELKKWLKTGK